MIKLDFKRDLINHPDIEFYTCDIGDWSFYFQGKFPHSDHWVYYIQFEDHCFKSETAKDKEECIKVCEEAINKIYNNLRKFETKRGLNV